MKKIELQLSNNKRHTISINIPDINNKTFLGKLHAFLGYVGTNILFLYLFIFSLSFLFFSSRTYETSAFLAFLVAQLTLITIIVLSLIISGSKSFLDPHGFLAILIFALVITASSLLVDQETSYRTFGNGGVKSLSGIAVMSYVSLYLSINIFARYKYQVKQVVHLVIASMLLLITYIALKEYSLFGVFFLIACLPIALLTLNTASKKLYLLLFILFTSVYIIFTYEPLDYKVYVPVLVYLLITSLVIALPVFIIDHSLLVKLVKSVQYHTSRILNSKTKNIEEAQNIVQSNLNKIAVLLSPIMILAIIIYMFSKDNNSFMLIENLPDTLSFIFDDLKNSSSNLAPLLGRGADNISINGTILENVFITQGIAGLVAYIGLWFYGISSSLNLFIREFRNRSEYYPYAAAMLGIITLVPLLFTVSNPGFLLFVLWWLALSLVSVMWVDRNDVNRNDFIIKDSEILNLTGNLIKIENLNKSTLNYILLVVTIITYIFCVYWVLTTKTII